MLEMDDFNSKYFIVLMPHIDKFGINTFFKLLFFEEKFIIVEGFISLYL